MTDESELKPVAWLHTMHMELDQTYDRLTASPDNPWGEPGEDYSAEYHVTSEPLYPASALRRVEELEDRIHSQVQCEALGYNAGRRHNETCIKTLEAKIAELQRELTDAKLTLTARPDRGMMET